MALRDTPRISIGREAAPHIRVVKPEETRTVRPDVPEQPRAAVVTRRPWHRLFGRLWGWRARESYLNALLDRLALELDRLHRSAGESTIRMKGPR